MPRILVIGMGAGNPEHLTIQAIDALRRVNVLFVTDKGAGKSDLTRLRLEIWQRYASGRKVRTEVVADPDRDRSPADYRTAVDSWHSRRALTYANLFRERLSTHDTGAFLVWGDPSLYDSTIRILEAVRARNTANFELEVIPGITAIQALAAQHRIVLNSIGGDVRITTGRRLAEERRLTSTNTVVLLDGDCAFRHVADNDVDIYWGAYLGMPDEILLSGALREICDTIQLTRAEARRRKGWIMDTYLLRRTPTVGPQRR